MSYAYLEPIETESAIEAELETAENGTSAAEISRAAENYSSPEAQQLRVTLVQDQLIAVAKKVNLLHGMGLERTSGYADAMALYEAKLADFNSLKARYGL